MPNYPPYPFDYPPDLPDVRDADAAIAEVLSPRTFYSVEAPKKTGNMPTVALDPASTAYPAGYHAGNAGGLPAVEVDLTAEKIKKDTVIFGVTGTYVGSVAHDIQGESARSGSCTSSQTMYYRLQSVGIGAEVDLYSLTQTYDATSLAEAYGCCHCRTGVANALKLRLYMGGVLVAETGYLTSTYALVSIKGYKALSGSQIVKLSVKNYSVGAVSLNIAGEAASSGTTDVGAVFSGSVKVVT